MSGALQGQFSPNRTSTAPRQPDPEDPVNAKALTLPLVAVRSTARVGRRLASKLALPALLGAAGLVYRAAHRPTVESARPTPDPGPVAAPTPAPAAQEKAQKPVQKTAEKTVQKTSADAVQEPMIVLEAEPLPDAAVDLDVEVVLPSELPIRSYDALRATDAVEAIRGLSKAEEVRTVLEFEEENGKRATVLSAGRARLAALSG